MHKIVPYLALLRGINVGGNNKLAMADLKTALTNLGLENVQTYIQSGNIVFSFAVHDTQTLAKNIQNCIAENFGLRVTVVVFTKAEWAKVINSAPAWWGKDANWKHNILVMVPPATAAEAIEAIGVIKPAIEHIEPGERVLYQAMSKELFGKTTTGKLASNTIYKKMTVRNYNTATKLLSLLDAEK
jgi:uncharacterized protein (DUF1697 family)